MTKYAEITQEMMDVWVHAHLRVRGFDLTKEIKVHAKWERNGEALTQCFSQEDNAPLLPQYQQKVDLETQRPDYLKDIK